MLPAQAEWVNRGLCHVWTGGGTPETPEDMLTGVIYDYNRDPKGEYFTYSGIYNKESNSAALGRSLKDAQKIRNTGPKTRPAVPMCMASVPRY